MFMILINLAAVMVFWWLIARLCIQAGSSITKKAKNITTKCSPLSSVSQMQDHPMLNDISSTIRNAPYGFAYSLIADRSGVTVELWNTDGSTRSQYFSFSAYGIPAPARDSQLNVFTAALKNRIPYGQHYTLTNHMAKDSCHDNDFYLSRVVFHPASGLPVPIFHNRHT